MRFVVQAEGTVRTASETRAGDGCRVLARRREAENFFLYTTIRISGGAEAPTGAATSVTLERSRLIEVEAETDEEARALVREGKGRDLSSSRRYEAQDEPRAVAS